MFKIFFPNRALLPSPIENWNCKTKKSCKTKDKVIFLKSISRNKIENKRLFRFAVLSRLKGIVFFEDYLTRDFIMGQKTLANKSNTSLAKVTAYMKDINWYPVKGEKTGCKAALCSAIQEGRPYFLQKEVDFLKRW